jgi:hypothetical protein
VSEVGWKLKSLSSVAVPPATRTSAGHVQIDRRCSGIAFGRGAGVGDKLNGRDGASRASRDLEVVDCKIFIAAVNAGRKPKI